MIKTIYTVYEAGFFFGDYSSIILMLKLTPINLSPQGFGEHRRKHCNGEYPMQYKNFRIEKKIINPPLNTEGVKYP